MSKKVGCSVSSRAHSYLVTLGNCKGEPVIVRIVPSCCPPTPAETDILGTQCHRADMTDDEPHDIRPNGEKKRRRGKIFHRHPVPCLVLVPRIGDILTGGGGRERNSELHGLATPPGNSGKRCWLATKDVLDMASRPAHTTQQDKRRSGKAVRGRRLGYGNIVLDTRIASQLLK